MSGPCQATLVVQHALHHGKMSGYHRLAEYPVARGVGRVATHRFPRRGTWRLAEPFARRSGLVHFLQGESTCRYAAHVPGSRRLVATLHLPPLVFGEYVGPMRHLERLDAIVFVARNQMEVLDRLGSRPAAYVVPHGIDVEFCVPPPSPTPCPTCLFVGQWLRDFTTLETVIAQMHRGAPRSTFRLVLPPGLASSWQHRPGVEVLTALDDLALRRCYQEAALLVTPFRDCMANNAVLEAMASGLAVVGTNTGGSGEILEDESNSLTFPPGDTRELTRQLKRLLDPYLLARLRREARQTVERRFTFSDMLRRVEAFL